MLPQITASSAYRGSTSITMTGATPSMAFIETDYVMSDLRLQPPGSHFIDGAYIDDDAGAEITAIFPATGEVVARLMRRQLM